MKAPYRCSLPAAAFAALAATSAGAEEPTLESLIHPQSQIEVGAGMVFDDGHRFGMYNGMSDSTVNPLFDASVLYRDDATGTWLRFFGNSTGTEGGQARFEHEKQGQWNYYLEGGRTTFENSRVIFSTLNGLGSTSNTVGATRRELDLEMHREKVKAGGGFRLREEFKVDFSARVERKTGGRQWGAQGFNFAVEPIEFTTQEYQGSVSYTGKQLQMQFGYLGSLFTNDAEAVSVQNLPAPPLSLPLDNMMHQIYVNGGYSFTPTTRGTFNASYSRATQGETFFTPPTFPGNTRRDLGGEVDNILLNLGLSSRPIKDLSTRLKFRYEERDDNTPRVQYIAPPAPPVTYDGFNVPFSRDTTTIDAEADYMLPMNFKLVGGVGYEHWNRSSPPIRKETDEYSGRVELRRPLLDTLSGSVGYAHSERRGSGHQLVSNPPVAGLTDPILWADRSRDKGRVTLDWSPRSDFSLQFVGEAALDDYTDDRFRGPQDGDYYLVSLDANYKLNDEWDLGGWVAWNETSIAYRTGTATTFEADLSHIGVAVGVSLRGKLTEKLKLSGDVQWSEDTSEHRIKTLIGAATTSLPDIVYRQWMFGLTGDYAIQENKGIKLKYGFSHVSADDWTWKGMVYADGTTVRIPDREQTHFVGASIYFRW